MKKRIVPLVVLFSLIGLAGCSETSSTSESSTPDSSVASSEVVASSEESSAEEESSSEASSEESAEEESSSGSEESSSGSEESSSSSEESSSAPVAVEGISLDQSYAYAEINGNVTLTATVSPDNATDYSITWSSENEDIATVENGVVTGVAAGSTTITATAGDYSATCTIIVQSAVSSISSIYSDENASGSYYRVQGLVVSTCGKSAFINDGAAGLYIYNFSSSSTDDGLDESGYFVQGSYVDVYGYISIYNGLYELCYTSGTSYVHTYTPASEITPTSGTITSADDLSAITTADTGKTYTVPYATYVSGTLSSSSASAVSLTFAVDGTNFVVRTDRYDVNYSTIYNTWTELNLSAGDLVSITAVASWYSGFQFSGLGSATTITKVDAPAPTAITLEASATEIYAEGTSTLSVSFAPWYASADVTYSIISGSEYATISGNVVTGVAAGTVTVQASYESIVSNSVEITVLAGEDTSVYYTYDFSSLTANGTTLTTATALTLLQNTYTGTATNPVSAVSAVSYVYSGNGTGGAFENVTTLLKLGNGSNNGSMTIDFTTGSNIKQVILTAHSWNTSTATTLAVGGISQSASTSGTAEQITYTFDSALDSITFATTGRVTVHSLTFVA